MSNNFLSLVCQPMSWQAILSGYVDGTAVRLLTPQCQREDWSSDTQDIRSKRLTQLAKRYTTETLDINGSLLLKLFSHYPYINWDKLDVSDIYQMLKFNNGYIGLMIKRLGLSEYVDKLRDKYFIEEDDFYFFGGLDVLLRSVALQDFKNNDDTLSVFQKIRALASGSDTFGNFNEYQLKILETADPCVYQAARPYMPLSQLRYLANRSAFPEEYQCYDVLDPLIQETLMNISVPVTSGRKQLHLIKDIPAMFYAAIYQGYKPKLRIDYDELVDFLRKE